LPKLAAAISDHHVVIDIIEHIYYEI